MSAAVSPNLSQAERSSRRRAIDMAGYTLGVDLGTTSVKVCLVNQADQSVSDLHVKESSAYTPSDADNGDQQNPSRIYSALYACLAKVPKSKMERVKRIAFSGQMHGVVYWKADSAWMVHPKEQKEVYVIPP